MVVLSDKLPVKDFLVEAQQEVEPYLSMSVWQLGVD